MGWLYRLEARGRIMAQALSWTGWVLVLCLCGSPKPQDPCQQLKCISDPWWKEAGLTSGIAGKQPHDEMDFRG